MTLGRSALWLALCLAGGAQAQDARTIFEKVSPSVVTVKVYDAAGVADGEGSGVVVGPNEVVTNCHVIDYAQSIQVVTRDRREREAIPTRGLAQSDLCLLRVENLASPAVALRVGADVVRGERVFAVGNPLGLGLAVSEGLTSALMPPAGQPRILTSASTSPGSSGGGLFDTQGRLIGITTSALSGQNITVAVPADLIARVRSEGEMVAAPPSPPEKDVDWHGTAEKLSNEREWKALADHAKRWLAAYPTSYFAARNLGRAQSHLGRPAEARDMLIALAKKFPRAANTFGDLAHAYAALGNLDLAEAAARQAIALTPGDGFAHSMLAEVQTLARNYDEAKKSADIAVRLSPWLAYSWEVRANSAFAAKRFLDAASDIRVLARLQPGNLQVRRKLAAALASAGQTGEARTLMADVGAARQDDAQVWGTIGYQETQRRRYTDAENAFRRAIEIDPQFVLGWTSLALVLRNTNRNQEAEQALRTAAKLDPNDKTVLAMLAEIVGKRGEAAEAANLLEKATQGESGTALHWHALGNSRYNARDFKGAADAYAKVVELDTSSINGWIDLGNVHAILRQDAQAIAALERAAKLDPNNERLLFAWSKFHGDRGDFARALEYAERSVEKYPASADSWNNKGFSLLRLLQAKPAIESLTTATRLDPDKAASWINLGEAYMRAGEFGRAIGALERALKLAPKAADARLFLSQAFAATGQLGIARKYIDALLQDAPQMAAAWLMSGMLGVAANDQDMALRAYEKLQAINPQLAAAFKKQAAARGDASRVRFPD